MNNINRETLIEKARALLSDGRVSSVLGWRRGEFDCDAIPAVFRSAEELEELVWSGFSSANLSKYLIEETRRSDSKVLVFLKHCDGFSFNQLLTEHRFERDKVYAIGLACGGMLDVDKLRGRADGILSVRDGDTVEIDTLYDGELRLERSELLCERCLSCKSKRLPDCDELLGEMSDDASPNRFAEVERIEAMSSDERFAFWQSELSRCVRCNACRDVCPACTCEQCVFGNPRSGVENKAAADPFDDKLFHVIRALHVAGRCTDCGECSRVCPQHIPLHLINRKLIKDMNELFGDYQAGERVGSRAPTVDFKKDDPEPSSVLRRGDHA